MNTVTILTGPHVSLRPWREADREPFAALNADPRVMEFFPALLNRTESDSMVDGIETHFAEHRFGLWALEIPGTVPFIGFAGLSVKRFAAAFTPCVEVGWRLASAYWGHGYASEAATLALDHAFGPLALPDVVSYTTSANLRSRAVMERLGMQRDPAEDFDHPALPADHPQRAHVLYRLDRNSWRAKP